MISSTNRPANSTTSDGDFTTTHYRELLRLAKAKYPLIDYHNIPFGQRFLLWRHDCDYSLNRSLVLGRIEHEEGVRATYFVNPHSEFYNLFERTQVDIVRELIALGHDIGLHFDGMFHTTADEVELESQLKHEADLLEHALGLRPIAFSFHNPSAFHLSCESDHYAGQVNCYSGRFKTQVPYCSDSNGYWRFRRLHDVLEQATDPCLQVLTHPGWWQEHPLSPRQRVFRCVYGRADATIRFFDAAIEAGGRENPSRTAKALGLLRSSDRNVFELCDYLWNRNQFPALFMELWRLHEGQINRLCKAELRQHWHISPVSINEFFESNKPPREGRKLFDAVFDKGWDIASGTDHATLAQWTATRNALVHGISLPAETDLEQGCIFLCNVIEALAKWGHAHRIAYDGLAALTVAGVALAPTFHSGLSERLDESVSDQTAVSSQQWQQLIAEMS